MRIQIEKTDLCGFINISKSYNYHIQRKRMRKMVIKILLGFYILVIIVFWLGWIDFRLLCRKDRDKNPPKKSSTILLIISCITLFLTGMIPAANFL